MAHRSTHILRRPSVIEALISMIAGLVITALLAIYVATAGPGPIQNQSVVISPRMQDQLHRWHGGSEVDAGAPPIQVERRWGPGWEQLDYHRANASFDTPSGVIVLYNPPLTPPRVIELRAGIPFRCFEGREGRWVIDWQGYEDGQPGAVAVIRESIVPLPDWCDFALESWFPVGPIWPGLIGNTVIWAIAWLVCARTIRAAVGRFIAARRKRRGECLACGYPLVSPDARRCPECGHSKDADAGPNPFNSIRWALAYLGITIIYATLSAGVVLPVWDSLRVTPNAEDIVPYLVAGATHAVVHFIDITIIPLIAPRPTEIAFLVNAAAYGALITWIASGVRRLQRRRRAVRM